MTPPTSHPAGSVLEAVRDVMRMIRQHSRAVLRMTIGVPLLWLIITLLIGPSYSASSSFMPEQVTGGQGQLAGLAAQFGVQLNLGGNVGDPVMFYAELLRTRGLWDAAAKTKMKFSLDGHGGRDTIETAPADLMKLKGVGPLELLRRLADRRRRHVLSATYREAGIVRLTTTARWPDIAAQLNRRLLVLVDSFNLERRQQRAGQERIFMESRLGEAQVALRTAEEGLRAFLDRNRRYEVSPDLRFEYGRLERAVQLRQSVYVQLASAFEQARIEEVRSAPVVTLVDSPESGVRRNGSFIVDGAIWTMLGALLGCAWALARSAFDAMFGPGLTPAGWVRRRFGREVPAA